MSGLVRGISPELQLLANVVRLGASTGVRALDRGLKIGLDLDDVAWTSVVRLSVGQTARDARRFASDALSLRGLPHDEVRYRLLEEGQVEEHIVVNEVLAKWLRGSRAATRGAHGLPLGWAPTPMSHTPQRRLELIGEAAVEQGHHTTLELLYGLFGTDLTTTDPAGIRAVMEDAIGGGQLFTGEQITDHFIDLFRRYARNGYVTTNFSPRAARELEMLLHDKDEFKRGNNPRYWKPRELFPFDVLIDNNAKAARLAVTYKNERVLALQPEALDPMSSVERMVMSLFGMKYPAHPLPMGIAWTDAELAEKIADVQRGQALLVPVFADLERILATGEPLPNVHLRYARQTAPQSVRFPSSGTNAGKSLVIRYSLAEALRWFGDPSDIVLGERALARQGFDERLAAEKLDHLQAGGLYRRLLASDGVFEETPPDPVVENVLDRLASDELRKRPLNGKKDGDLLKRPMRWMTPEARVQAETLVARLETRAYGSQLPDVNSKNNGKGGGSSLGETAGRVVGLSASAIYGWMRELFLAGELSGGSERARMVGKLLASGGMWADIARHPSHLTSRGIAQAIGIGVEEIFVLLMTETYDWFMNHDDVLEAKREALREDRPENLARFQHFAKLTLRPMPGHVHNIIQEFFAMIEEWKQGWQQVGSLLVDLFSHALGPVVKATFQRSWNQVRDRRLANGMFPDNLDNTDDLYALGHNFLRRAQILFGDGPLGWLISQALVHWQKGPKEALEALIDLPANLATYWGASTLSKYTRMVGLGNLEATTHHHLAAKVADETLVALGISADNPDLKEVVTLLTGLAQGLLDTRPEEAAKDNFDIVINTAARMIPINDPVAIALYHGALTNAAQQAKAAVFD